MLTELQLPSQFNRTYIPTKADIKVMSNGLFDQDAGMELLKSTTSLKYYFRQYNKGTINKVYDLIAISFILCIM